MVIAWSPENEITVPEYVTRVWGLVRVGIIGDLLPDIIVQVRGCKDPIFIECLAANSFQEMARKNGVLTARASRIRNFFIALSSSDHLPRHPLNHIANKSLRSG